VSPPYIFSYRNRITTFYILRHRNHIGICEFLSFDEIILVVSLDVISVHPLQQRVYTACCVLIMVERAGAAYTSLKEL